MIYLGIDPGKSGAMTLMRNPSSIASAVFDETSYLNLLYDAMYTAHGNTKGIFAIVEKVHAMPKQGVTSMFSFGHNLGWIEGVLAANRIPYQLVSPQTWKRAFGLSFERGTDKKVVKNASIATAHKLFPMVSLRATERCKTDHDGIAESLLMAEYGRRIHS